MAHRTFKVEESSGPEAVLTHDIIEGTITSVDFAGKKIDVDLDSPYKPRNLTTTHWGRLQEDGYDSLPSSPVVEQLSDVPVIYNCEFVTEDPMGAFLIGEKVLILAIGTDYSAVGFPDEVKDCGPRWVYFQMAGGGLGEDDYCTVFDIVLNAKATDIPLNGNGGFASFPVKCSEISEWIAQREVVGTDLYTEEPRGSEIELTPPTGPALDICRSSYFTTANCGANWVSCTAHPGGPGCACETCNCAKVDSREDDNPNDGISGSESLKNTWAVSSSHFIHNCCCVPGSRLDNCGYHARTFVRTNTNPATEPPTRSPLGWRPAYMMASSELPIQNAYGDPGGLDRKTAFRSEQNLVQNFSSDYWISSGIHFCCSGNIIIGPPYTYACPDPPCPNQSIIPLCHPNCGNPTSQVQSRTWSYKVETPIGAFADFDVTDITNNTAYPPGSEACSRTRKELVATGFLTKGEGMHFGQFTPGVMVQIFAYRWVIRQTAQTSGGTCCNTLISPSTQTYEPIQHDAIASCQFGIDADNKDPTTQPKNTALSDVIIECMQTWQDDNTHGTSEFPLLDIPVARLYV